MKRFFTLDDVTDTYSKIRQRGLSFVSSKLNFNPVERTKSAFNELYIPSSNWWIIPKVQERWNQLITNDPNLEYEKFTVDTFLEPNKSLKMLSLGSGNCSHELRFASFPNYFETIICIDISDKLLDEGKNYADAKGYKNISFKAQNIDDYDFPINEFDVVLFHASLHHFKNMEDLLGTKIKRTLKVGGKIIMNEYVGSNRLQYPNDQIKAINDSLNLIPKNFRQRFKMTTFKNKIYGSGLIRMVLADPSECVESQEILSNIRKYYKTIYEAPYGGNILMTALKDISHHFIELNDENERVLNALFEYEDSYLKSHGSDFVFGIYEKTKD